MKAAPVITPLTELVARRRALLKQLDDLDTLMAQRPALVKQIDDLGVLIERCAPPIQDTPGPSKRGRPPKYEPAVSAAVADLTRAGLSEREIGERLNIPHQSVANMQRREGARPTSKKGGARTPYGPEVVESVKALAAAGLSKRKIAAKLGMPPSSVDTLKKKFRET